MGKNDGIKAGQTVNDRVITKKELDIANAIGVDVRLVKEDTQNKTGVVMILTDLNAVKEYCGTHRSLSPSFFRIGVKTEGETVPVSINISAYNKKAPASKGASTSSNVL